MCFFCIDPSQRVWDELDNLHTRLTAVEVELQDVSEMHPDETRLILDNLANTQQTHTRLNKQAEQRTTFLSKVTWIDSHDALLHIKGTFHPKISKEVENDRRKTRVSVNNNLLCYLKCVIYTVSV